MSPVADCKVDRARVRERENYKFTAKNSGNSVILCCSLSITTVIWPPLLISGIVLPVWNPQNPSVGDKVARAIVYFVALVYMFLGMSIIADRFMSSIEVGNTLMTKHIYC